MKTSRLTDEQAVAILAEAVRGEKTIGEVCRAQGGAEATFYNWRKRFRGMGMEEVREHRELKEEDAHLYYVLRTSNPPRSRAVHKAARPQNTQGPVE